MMKRQLTLMAAAAFALAALTPARADDEDDLRDQLDLIQAQLDQIEADRQAAEIDRQYHCGPITGWGKGIWTDHSKRDGHKHGHE